MIDYFYHHTHLLTSAPNSRRAGAVCIDSTIIVQESQQRRPEHGWKGEHLLVILSEAKDLVAQRARS